MTLQTFNKKGKPKGSAVTRYVVTLEIDATADEQKVKHDINYALNMAVVDRDFYDLSITHACKIKVQKKAPIL